MLPSAGRVASERSEHAYRDLAATVLHVVVDGEVVGTLSLTDVIRPESRQAVDALRARNVQVVMITGDAEAVASSVAAELGIAIGAGTDVAIASAGVILASDDPRSVLSVIDLSHASYRKMTQNLWLAAGYNLVSVPLAAGVLTPIGFVLPMSVGAILMSLSTIVVALNAQLLRRLDLRPGAGMRAAHGTVAVATVSG